MLLYLFEIYGKSELTMQIEFSYTRDFAVFKYFWILAFDRKLSLRGSIKNKENTKGFVYCLIAKYQGVMSAFNNKATDIEYRGNFQLFLFLLNYCC